MSVAVVEREVIAALPAFDAVTRSSAELAPGTRIAQSRIHKHTRAEIEDGAAPYAVRFQWNGREYSCPLALFQPRTRALDAGARDADARAI